MGTAAAAVIVAREKHIVAAFRNAGALTADAAVVPATIGVSERLAFRLLRQHAVLREAQPGYFYLDELSWQALRSMRKRLALAWLLVILVVAVAFLTRSS